MFFQIYLTNMLRAFSLALELTSGGLSRHHWRTAMIADRLADHLALPPGQRQTVLYAALLHDIGAAANWQEKVSLINRRPVANHYAHAVAGHELLKDSSVFQAVATPILHHHDHWDGSSPAGLAGDAIPLPARIINLADSLEVMVADTPFILDQREAILTELVRHAGSQFAPDLVAALKEITGQESFWFDLVNPHYYENFFQNISSYGQVRLDVDEVIEAAGIFATIIDRTSRYTARHSRRVAEVAAFLAAAKGYSAAEVKLIRLAGLLHDLGKLAVPNEILEKPGKLTPHEFALIQQHPYYTHRILDQIDGFDIIADWAGFHHETLDGTGYPFRIPGENLRLGSRIVAVADVFTAVTESRPYRPDLTAAQVEKILLDMAAARRLDPDLVRELLACRDIMADIVATPA